MPSDCAGIQVLAHMVTGREGSPQDASSFLSKVFQSTDQHLDAFQQLSALFEGIINQQGDWTDAMSRPLFQCPDLCKGLFHAQVTLAAGTTSF